MVRQAARNDDIVARYHGGEDRRSIAGAKGVKIDVIHGVLYRAEAEAKAAGLPRIGPRPAECPIVSTRRVKPPPPPPRPTPVLDCLPEAMRLRALGLRWKEIGRMLLANPQTLRTLASLNGLSGRPKCGIARCRGCPDCRGIRNTPEEDAALL